MNMLYLTDKGLLLRYDERGKRFELWDAFSCVETFGLKEFDHKFCEYKLRLCAVLGNTDSRAFFETHSVQSDAIINCCLFEEGIACNTFSAFIKLYTQSQEQLEGMVAQVVAGDRFDSSLMQKLLNIHSELDYGMKAGIKGKEFYEREFSDLAQANILDIYKCHRDLVRLGETIKYELEHAEYRFGNLLCSVSRCIRKESEVFIKEKLEIEKYSRDSDQCVWDIIDVAKALSTSLDVASKYFFFVEQLVLGRNNRIPATHASELLDVSSDKLQMDNVEKLLFVEVCNRLKSLVMFRHHLTHDRGLSSLRTPLLIGYGTGSIGNKKAFCGEMPFWDKNEGHFASCQGRVGFYQQYLNGLSELYNWFLDVISLNKLISIHMYNRLATLIDKDKHMIHWYSFDRQEFLSIRPQ